MPQAMPKTQVPAASPVQTPAAAGTSLSPQDDGNRNLFAQLLQALFLGGGRTPAEQQQRLLRQKQQAFGAPGLAGATGGALTDMSQAGPWGAGMASLPQTAPVPTPSPGDPTGQGDIPLPQGRPSPVRYRNRGERD